MTSAAHAFPEPMAAPMAADRRRAQRRALDDVQEAAFVQIAEDAGGLCIALAEANGHVDSASRAVSHQAGVFSDLRGDVVTMSGAVSTVTAAASGALAATASAGATVTTGKTRIDTMTTGTLHLADEVAAIGAQIDALSAALGSVSNAMADISSISRTTNLLAVNAAIEATRAGPAGAGFMVVAREIKALSTRTQEATQEIRDTLARLSAQTAALVTTSAATRDRAQSLRVEAGGVDEVMQAITTTVATVEERQQDITSAASLCERTIRSFETRLSGLTEGLTASSTNLTALSGELGTVLTAGERLVTLCGGLGIETADSPYINAVRDTAARIAAAFEAGIKAGQFTEADLFDTVYRPVEGSDPQQVLTRVTAITDRLLPAFQEPLLALSDRVVFAACVDRNGYLPTHNRKFSQPQRRGDPVWNTANSRNRRIFDDRVGKAAGQNTSDFLLQAYRRDMGNGVFRMMKDVSAPIRVGGRHWGGLRLAYTA